MVHKTDANDLVGGEVSSGHGGHNQKNNTDGGEIGHIIYSTYRIIEDKATIVLFGRLKSGESFMATVPFRPYFFIEKPNLEKAKRLFPAEYEETDLKTFGETAVTKVILNKPGDVPEARRAFEKEGITCYEADIRFSQRFLIDKDIYGPIKIFGDYLPKEADKKQAGAVEMGRGGEEIGPERSETQTEKTDYTDRTYNDAEVLPAENYDAELKILSMDIETSYDASEVYCVSFYSQSYPDTIEEAHIVSGKKIPKATSYSSEKELVEAIKKRITELDPDIITGWNIIDFDLVVLSKRFKHHHIPFTLGRTGDESKLRLEQSFFRDSTIDIPGRIVLDGIALLKMSFIDLPDYKLNTAAQEFLGDQKVAIENMRENLAAILKNEPELLVRYNIKDSELAYNIIKKKKLVELTLKKAQITGMQLDKVKGSVASLDSLYLRKARKRGYVCPCAGHSDREERIKGAFVMAPNPGIYDYVVVLDFKSLYPSIIRTFNIDPISHKGTGTITAPNGARFENTETDAILPEIITTLDAERGAAKKEKDAVKSFAIKIIMNSFYGVLANPTCRFYNMDMANAITSFGRQIVKETAALVAGKGYNVIYGDTDSVFVDTTAENFEGASKIGNEIQEIVTKHFLEQVKRDYNRKSQLVLQYEKTYKVFMLPKIRGKEAGAKKRYAGLLIDEGKEKMDITGLEFVRSDWTPLAKNLQLELLDRVFHKKEVYTYIKRLIDDLKEGKHDKDLIYRKSIRKELVDYTKTTPPHVKAARLLPSLDSSVIEYYMTENGPEPVQLKRSKIDYNHYLEKQVRPIAESILALYGKSFDDLLSGSGQKKLFDY